MALPKIETVLTGLNYGRFKIEPLEPGYGITLGNALRRVLLSSLPGAAVTWIRIDGAYHEFATVPHTKEDVTEIVLNMKRIRLHSFADRQVRLQLHATGERAVTAGDIEVPAEVEIVNPELHLATLSSDEARLDVELTVERGRGYSSAEQRDSMPIGMIPIDAIFTPIPKVNYVVEHTRIGQVTDYDRLILEIWTDGTVDPEDALSQAAQILTQHFSLIADFNKVEVGIESKQPIGAVITPEAQAKPIEDLDLSMRTYNCLKRAGITKVGQVLAMDEKDLLSIRNFGRKSLEELRERLATHGFIPSGRLGEDGLGEDAFGDEDEEEEDEAEESASGQEDDASEDAERTASE